MIYANEIDTSEETFENECNSMLGVKQKNYIIVTQRAYYSAF